MRTIALLCWSIISSSNGSISQSGGTGGANGGSNDGSGQAKQKNGSLTPDTKAALTGTGLADHPQIDDSFINGYIDGGLTMIPDADNGSIYSIQSAVRMKEDKCVKESVINLRLISGSGRMTAGEVNVAERGQQLVYLYAGMESEFLYIPGSDYEDIVKVVDEKYISSDPDAPILFDRHLVPKLPVIEVQFSKTKVIFQMRPENYTWCKAKDPSSPASKCILLVKRSKMEDHWNLGRPFLNGLITVASVASTRPFVQMCYPNSGSSMSHYRLTDRVVGMPWNINDTLIVVGVVLIVLIIPLYFYGDKIKCFKRRRRNASQPGDTTAPTSTSENITQPLIANPA